jgi:hypothetical protein
MKKLLPIALLLAVGCGEPATDDGIVIQTECTSDCGERGKGDQVGGEKIEPVALQGPGVRCNVVKGDSADPDFRTDSLECNLTTESGFTVTKVLFGGADAPFEMTLLNGDTAQLAGFEPVSVGTLASTDYPVSFTIQVVYNTSAIVGYNGRTGSLATAAKCDVQFASADDAGEIVCGADNYELWLVELAPDADVAAAWDAGEYGSASFSAGVILQTPSDQLCFVDSNACGPSGTVSASWGFSDKNQLESEVYYLVPAGSPDMLVTLAARVPSGASAQATELAGPGRYLINGFGGLTPAP